SEVVVYTSREVIGGGETRTEFDIGQSVSDALVEVLDRVDRQISLAYVVAKGGITSSDVATKGLKVRRAEVAGQMLPGIISVWTLPDDSEFPGLPYIIFAGNVGDDDSLAKVIDILREE
ncbi:MAG: nucleotide-binding domain containing protein, partial [Rubrobacteraceae bacterium]